MPPKAESGSTSARLDVGLLQGRAGRHPAGVGVLDDRRRRFGELQGETGSRVEVEQVGEREGLALEHARVAESPVALLVEGGGLVRVLAVAQVADLRRPQQEVVRDDAVQLERGPGELGSTGVDVRQRCGDGRVVGGRVGERLPRQLEAERPGQSARPAGPTPCTASAGFTGAAGLAGAARPAGAAGFTGAARPAGTTGFVRPPIESRVQCLEHAAVVGRVHNDEDILEALGRGSNHRRPADVDLLEQLLHRRLRRRGPGERVEVDHHDVDRLDSCPRIASRSSGLLRRARMPP